MKIKPLNDMLVVKRIKSQDISKGGIIIPDIAKVKSAEGIVIAVGNGRILADGNKIPLGIKEEDRSDEWKWFSREDLEKNEEGLSESIKFYALKALEELGK